MLELVKRLNEQIKFIENEIFKKINVFYSGGGIWIAEKNIDKNRYAIVSSDFIDCLTIYEETRDREKYYPQDMLFSEHKDKLNEIGKEIYNTLKEALEKEMQK